MGVMRSLNDVSRSLYEFSAIQGLHGWVGVLCVFTLFRLFGSLIRILIVTSPKSPPVSHGHLLCAFIDWSLRTLWKIIQLEEKMDTRFTRGKSNILERPLTRPKTEVSLSTFALLFSEMVQYCQSRVYSVSELQTRLADMGQSVGASMLDVLVLREKNGKRETKVLNMLLFIKVGIISVAFNGFELWLIL